MGDLSEVTVEALIEYWGRHIEKLSESGAPMDRIIRSMTKAALQAETEWLTTLIREGDTAALARLAAPEGSPKDE